MDLQYDRQHPKKKFRPIASGEITQYTAVLFLAVLIIINILTIYYFQISKIGVGFILTYCVLNFLYSFGLKNIPLLELAILSSGFIIRLLFGANEASISLSPWIILCTGILSLMIAVGKRRSDLQQQFNNQSKTRASLKGYNLEFLDQINAMLASITIMSYLLFSASESASTSIGTEVMWTSPFVIFSILRYLQLISVNNQGDDPTSMLIRDKITIYLFIVWLVLIISMIYFN
jgi:4-hydroxybenzoate polyprenyltransferase